MIVAPHSCTRKKEKDWPEAIYPALCNKMQSHLFVHLQFQSGMYLIICFGISACIQSTN